jgi:transcriptional regulator with XRE-family HTH domain
MSQKQNGTLQKKTQDFQSILKSERVQRGWSQADVAGKIGSDPKTVGRWERGVTFPGPYMCQQLSKLYEKSLPELGLIRADTPLFVDENSESENGESAAPVEAVQPVSMRHYRGRRLFFYLGLLIIFLLLINSGILWWFLHKSPPSAAAPLSNPYASKGTLALNEKLAANSAAGWDLKRNAQGHCFFADGSYHILDVAEGYMEVCLANETYFTNYAYEVKMSITAGDCGGLAFRSTFPQLYYFLACLDGRYRFVRYDWTNMANTRVIAQGISPAIHQGLHTTNILAVVAINETFKIYVNHILVISATDGAYLDGQVGMLANTCRMVYPNDPRPNLCDAPTEVSFNDARVWTM